jgi:hypothetical protein
MLTLVIYLSDSVQIILILQLKNCNSKCILFHFVLFSLALDVLLRALFSLFFECSLSSLSATFIMI